MEIIKKGLKNIIQVSQCLFTVTNQTWNYPQSINEKFTKEINSTLKVITINNYTCETKDIQAKLLWIYCENHRWPKQLHKNLKPKTPQKNRHIKLITGRTWSEESFIINKCIDIPRHSHTVGSKGLQLVNPLGFQLGYPLSHSTTPPKVGVFCLFPRKGYPVEALLWQAA